jgi:hypothetical protein
MYMFIENTSDTHTCRIFNGTPCDKNYSISEQTGIDQYGLGIAVSQDGCGFWKST